MTTFSDAATDFLAPLGAGDVRRRAWAAFEEVGLPTTSDEVWRYAPLSRFSLERFALATTPRLVEPSDFAQSLASRAGLVVRVVDGFLEGAGALEGVSVTTNDDEATLSGESRVARYADDAFALLNATFAPSTIVIHVAPGVRVERPIVVVNVTNSSTSFPRLHVEVERGANATIVEYYEGGEDALVVPVSEYHVGENASLQIVTYQRLGASAWHVARSTGLLERDARLRQAVVGVGAHYDRSRNDAEMRASGAANELRTTYLGAGEQVHDFRTHQFHVAPRTQSTLLAKGAVADSSRSIYTGLIEIEKGAKRTDARQTNRNLLLSPHAHADSVPNLDIRENDVVCAHASSVGPLDEMQRWYLESRGVERGDAERLMIQGFFNEMMVALPEDVALLIEADVNAALSAIEVHS
jgi:Fe-S cluster assembly protein SufD